MVCEECGFASKEQTEKSVQKGNYIWVINPKWPEFYSFEDLYKITLRSATPMPSFSICSNYPSRLFTALLELLHDLNSDIKSDTPPPPHIKER